MKKSIVVTVVAAALVGAGLDVARSQGTDRPELSCAGKFAAADPKQLEKWYLPCLMSDNDGVVESALGHVTQMKLCLPDQDFPLVQQAVANLSVAGSTPAIRTKAYLASLVYGSPELFNIERTMEFRTPRELFTALAARVSKNLLSYGDRKYVWPD